MDNTYCLPNYQIPPAFLNDLSITNNNKGKLDANVSVTNCYVLFAAYRARVRGPYAKYDENKTVYFVAF